MTSKKTNKVLMIGNMSPHKTRALVLKAKEKNQLTQNWYPFQYLRTIIAGQASEARQASEHVKPVSEP